MNDNKRSPERGDDLRRLNEALEQRIKTRNFGIMQSADQLRDEVKERMLAEEALVKSEAHTRGILNALPATIAVVGRNGTIERINRAWREFARDNAGDAKKCNVGANYLEICRKAEGSHAEGAKDVLQGLQEMLAGKRSDFTYEYPCHSATEQRWFLLQARPMGNEVEGIVLCHINITKRKQAEDRLRNSEDRLKRILDTLSDGVIEVNSTGKILDCNPAAARILGHSQSTLLGENIKAMVREMDGSPYQLNCQVDNVLNRQEDGDSPRLLEKIGIRANTSRVPIEISSTYVERTGSFICLLRDISQRRRLEQEMLKVSEDEKREFAHDLHDSLCQELGGLGYMAGALADRLGTESHPNADQARRIANKMVQTMEAARKLSHSLDPLMEGPEGLQIALRLLANATKELFKLDCRFRLMGTVHPQDTNTATNLYRIAQEALHNAFRHGKATRVTISLKEQKGRIVMKILDNGSGLPTGNLTGEGIGLRIIQYRVTNLGGWHSISNRANGGVELVCSVPNSNLEPGSPSQ